MHIKELSIAEFDNFALNNPLGSYYQSSNYALFMAENGFDYEFLGLVDELGVIKAASLILIKKINRKDKFGYAPKGFLIDYFDMDLLKVFVDELKKHYAKELVFIKINPEIAIGEVMPKTFLANYNQNIIIRDYLKEVGFIKLKDNLYFEAILPRFNGIVNLEKYSFDNLNKNTKNNIRKALKRGLVIEKVDRNGIDTLMPFINRKKMVGEYYYKSYYNIFNKDNMSDIFLVKIDYQQYLLNSKKLYDEESVKNNQLALKLIEDSSEININKKMNSDKALLSYKNDIQVATQGMMENKTTYLAGALVIKYKNRVNIVISGIDKTYKKYNANYFLHNEILKYYQNNNYKFVDLNGLTGDFSNSNPYNGLNEFKLGFKPHVYEFIGEFDLALNSKAYNSLAKNGTLAQFFAK